MTLTEAQDLLQKVQVAKSNLIEGKTMKRFHVSSGNFKREYEFVTGDLAGNLAALKDVELDLLAIIDTLSTDSIAQFRKSAVFENVVMKRS